MSTRFRGVAKNLLESGSKSSRMSKGILGCRAAKAAYFGSFSMRFHVLQPVFFGFGAILCALDLSWGMYGAVWVLRGVVVGNMKFLDFVDLS